MKDIGSYITKLGLKHITTGGILLEALKASLITEKDGNAIWSAMLQERRKIGASSFSEYLNKLK